MKTTYAHRDIYYECEWVPKDDGTWAWTMMVLKPDVSAIRTGTASSEGKALGAAMEAGQKAIDALLDDAQ